MRFLTQISSHWGKSAKNRNSLQLVFESKYIHTPCHSGVSDEGLYICLNPFDICFWIKCLCSTSRTKKKQELPMHHKAVGCKVFHWIFVDFCHINLTHYTPWKLTWKSKHLVVSKMFPPLFLGYIFKFHVRFFQGGVSQLWRISRLSHYEWISFPIRQSLRRRLTARLHSEDCLTFLLKDIDVFPMSFSHFNQVIFLNSGRGMFFGLSPNADEEVNASFQSKAPHSWDTLW